MTTGKCGNWVETFPGNLRWSNATQIVKGMVPWAAAAMGEIDAVVQRLQAREHDGEPDRAWSEEWGAMGDKVAKIADTAAAEGREITAGNNYMRRVRTRWRCTRRRSAATARHCNGFIRTWRWSTFPMRRSRSPPIS